MDDSSIAGRTEKLRREIDLIQQEECRYRSHRNHAFVDKAAHDEREQRMIAIREELRTLVEKQNSNQATDQSGTVDLFLSGQ